MSKTTNSPTGLTKAMAALTRTAAKFAAALAAAAVLVTPLAAEATQRIERKITVGGMTREYIAYLPDNPKGKDSWPIMMAFHPALGTASYMEKTTRLHATKGAENFVVVYPDGFRRTWNAGDCCGLAKKRNIDDLGFFNAIRKDLATMLPVREKVYVTGYSNGARMVYHLVCKQPGTIAAAVPFAATRDMSSGCASGRVPLMHIHGDADEGSPVEGGYAKSAAIKNTLGYMAPALQVVKEVAQHNGCSVSSASQMKESDLGTTCTAYTNCPGNADAVLCVIPGLGHVWPGSNESSKRFGPARPDLRGSLAVVDFFRQH